MATVFPTADGSHLEDILGVDDLPVSLSVACAVKRKS
jgi:hypothetical protein